MRNICVITGTRAEYGLLYWLIKALDNDPEVNLQLCVTGMHWSPEFGLTHREIQKDGFVIAKKVECLLSADSPSGISKSLGLGVIGFSDAFDELKPDLLVVLGDRFEILAGVLAALFAGIPVGHCHGGESSEGAYDEAIRHAITKMSHLHFVSTDGYRKRVVQMGESPDRVFNVGAFGIENINKLSLLNREDFEGAISFKLGDKNLLVTYHPETLDPTPPRVVFGQILSALDSLSETKIIFTYPNADTRGKEIVEMIEHYVSMNSRKAISIVSMGQLKYLSAMCHVDAVVGNSSSGLIEAPSFKIGTINIGHRQKGRVRADSIIDCDPITTSMVEAFNKLYSDDFQEKLRSTINPHGSGNASEKVIPILKNFDLEKILKKEFFGLDLKLESIQQSPPNVFPD